MEATAHPFEKAGLGQAPFHVIGMDQKLFTPHPGAPSKPGGTCDYCSTGILYCFAIRSADGKEFVVGSDCVRKTTQEDKLLTDVQMLKRAHDARMRKEKRGARRALLTEQFHAIFDSPETMALLAEFPHPKIADLTLADYVSWMWRNAGDDGREGVLQVVRNALKK